MTRWEGIGTRRSLWYTHRISNGNNSNKPLLKSNAIPSIRQPRPLGVSPIESWWVIASTPLRYVEPSLSYTSTLSFNLFTLSISLHPSPTLYFLSSFSLSQPPSFFHPLSTLSLRSPRSTKCRFPCSSMDSGFFIFIWFSSLLLTYWFPFFIYSLFSIHFF